MKPDGVLESVLYADDLDAAEAFYSQTLGLEIIRPADDRQVFLRCGGGVLLIFNAAETRKPVAAQSPFPVPPHGALGSGHLCFRASAVEIETWKSRLLSAGVEIEADFLWPSGGRSIYFRDPAGNSLEFAEPVIWGLE